MTSTELLRKFSREKREKQHQNHHGTGDHVSTSISGNGTDILQVYTGQSRRNHHQGFVIQSHSGCGDQIEATKSQSQIELTNVLEMFTKNRESPQPEIHNLPISFDPRSLFNNSPKCVPHNSDAESDD
jgi:hypothetical protein